MDDLFTQAEPETLALSDEQRRAVEHASGPLIVLAGPGTGKTRVITARVAHMVRERGVDPSSVLAVTFTNKSAGELRERLGLLVDPSSVSRMRAGTLHAFGMRLLRRFGDVIGLAPEPEILDSAQERRLARELIRGNGLYQESVGEGIEAAVDRGLRVTRELMSLGITPGEALARADSAESAMENEDDPGVHSARAELGIFRDGARLAALMDDACLERGTPRFDDLIRWPIMVLARSRTARDIVRSECRHVVVDEFQDLNATQIELLAQLCPPGADPDICVVGDDDQSIYAFRGADERAFERFQQRWGAERVTTLRLSTNYRSSRTVIAASNAVIGRASYRFAPDKQAVPGPDNPEGGPIEIVRLPKATESPMVIAGMLRASLVDDPGQDLSKTAVIARSKLELIRMSAALEDEGIPFISSVDDAAHDDPGVTLVLAWCRLLVDPCCVWAARTVLTRAPFRCDPAELGAIDQAYRRARSGSVIDGPDAASPPAGMGGGQADGEQSTVGAFLAWALEHATGTTRQAIERARSIEQSLGGSVAGLNADEALMLVVRETGAAHAEHLNRRERSARVRSLVGLIRFVRERLTRLDEPRDLRAMLGYLDDLPSKERLFARAPSEHVDPEIEEPGNEGGSGAVRLLTAHASKGLEFDTVYVARVCPPSGFPGSRDNNDELIPRVVLDPDPHGLGGHERLMDEERRVFFVALTRAERRVVLLAKPPKGKTKAVHYPLELLGEVDLPIVDRDWTEVMPGGSDPSALPDELDASRRDGHDPDRHGAILASATRAARRRAADALDAIQRGEPDAHSALAQAGDQLAMIAHIAAEGSPPEWAEQRGLSDEAARLMDRLGAGAGDDAAARAMRAPLQLSYSAIRSYRDCPRCFYVQHVLGLKGADSHASALGSVVHKALESFTRQWASDDSEGREPPGWERLEQLTRRMFVRHWPSEIDLDPVHLERALAQTRLFFDRFHDANAHLLEPELRFELPFVVDGQTHQIRGSIDRIEQLPSGGRRLVDYKTGVPTESLRKPASDDMQLAIYSMALEHRGELQPGDSSVGEYWMLASGDLGSIPLASLKLDKVREKMSAAIRGMLAGEFDRSKNTCRGDCAFLDDTGGL